MSLKTFAVALVTLGALDQSYAVCLNPTEMPDDSKSTYVAVQFLTWSNVSLEHKARLTPYLLMNGTGALEQIYESWLIKKNEQASSYFGVMHALSQIQLDLGGGVVETADKMVGAIVALKGDRIQVKLDVQKFEAWRQNKGRYASRNGNKIEAGEIGFHTGSTMGGSLHCGYDIQGFTKRANAPSVQWNLRYKDGVADIDMDGNNPLFWKVFPNPSHYTYRNSDVRFWFAKFFKKFESPGYIVQKRVL